VDESAVVRRVGGFERGLVWLLLAVTVLLIVIVVLLFLGCDTETTLGGLTNV